MVRSACMTLLMAGFAACSSATNAPADSPDAQAPDSLLDAGIPDAGPPLEHDGGSAADGGILEATGCVTDVSAGHHVFTCDGYEFEVRLPAACTSGGCGMVIDVHGLTMSAAIEDANTNLRAIGEREGFVVVQPMAKGPGPGWSASEYEAVWGAVSTIRDALRIDAKRVHVTGFSQGGMMAFAFACQHADEIASAAPAAQRGCTRAELAAVSRQVPLLYLHGIDDRLAGFTSLAVPQRDDLVAAWGLGPATQVAGDTSYTWSRYTNASGAVFEFIEHQYSASSFILGGHCFPGSTDPGGLDGQLFSFACKPPNAFVWGEEVIKFFKAHPLP